MTILTLDSSRISHKRVLMRLDLNLPMTNGQVTDFTRIDRSLETIRYLIDHSAKVILMSHFGRPTIPTLETSLGCLVPFLSERLKTPVFFAADCIGPRASDAVKTLQPGQVLLLENLRYHGEEEQNDPLFSKKLAQLGDVFVNDAFSCCHRAHGSIVGLTPLLPSFAGKSLEKEIQALSRFLTPPTPPVMAILGGAKISSKLALLKQLLPKMDYIAVGGGMANTFLAAQGKPTGLSLIEKDFVPQAQVIMDQSKQNNCQLILPEDVVVIDSTPESGPEVMVPDFLSSTAKIGDIGPKTVERIKTILKTCGTVIWNGPVGIFERPPFHKSSLELAQAISFLTKTCSLISVAGGGETLACLAQAECSQGFTYTSTGGGAFLEWLEGKTLPGLASLEKAATLWAEHFEEKKEQL